MLFINYLYDLFANYLGMKLYNLIGSFFLLIINILVLLIILSLIKKPFKLSNKANIIFFSIILLLIIFVLVIPFNRGRQINDLNVLGYKTVEAINKYEFENNRLPANLKELNPKYISDAEMKNVNSFVRYGITDHKKKNENDKYSKGYIPLEKDIFSLWIKKDILGLEFLRFNRNNNQFELTDD